MQATIDFWVDTHKKINNNDYSADEGERILNTVEEFNKIYCSRVAEKLEELCGRISASMKCFRKYYLQDLDLLDDSTEKQNIL